MSADNKIADVLAKFGEPMAGNVWRVQGNAVIYHKTLERIAAQAQIRFDLPTIIRAETDEAVLLVVGRMGERMEWSIGEATMQGGSHPGNYRVSGKQAAYPYAMAEKRAKDRVILKLIELHGLVYSEEEADEFKEARPTSTASSPSSQDNALASGPSDDMPIKDAEAFKAKINSIQRRENIPIYMRSLAVEKFLAILPKEEADAMKDFARDRYKGMAA